MSRLIDADALINKPWLVKYRPYKEDGTIKEAQSLIEETVRECKLVVASAPTVDAEPVRHGEWLDAEDTGIKMAECSICGARNTVHTYLYKPYPWRWCYRCGAKMDNAEWGRDT